MAEKSRDPDIAALEAVYAALKNLDDLSRKKVLSSVFALLGLDQTVSGQVGLRHISPEPQGSLIAPARPIGLGELINEKKPGTNAQRIALFAYYREKSEAISRFGRDDLKSYFSKAKLPPAANFTRDFVEAVKRGWIHEDGLDSYLTTKGIEAVESAFEGERKYTKGKGRGKGSTQKRASRRSSTRSKRAKRS